jgi:hypothetical protein
MDRLDTKAILTSLQVSHESVRFIDSAAQASALREWEQRTDPCGQTVARLQSLEGALVGISFAPALHA